MPGPATFNSPSSGCPKRHSKTPRNSTAPTSRQKTICSISSCFSRLLKNPFETSNALWGGRISLIRTRTGAHIQDVNELAMLRNAQNIPHLDEEGWTRHQ